jgi:hypothetical protein
VKLAFLSVIIRDIRGYYSCITAAERLWDLHFPFKYVSTSVPAISYIRGIFALCDSLTAPSGWSSRASGSV